MTLNPEQFNLEYKPGDQLPNRTLVGGEHAIVAHVPNKNKPVGILAWGNKDAPIEEDEDNPGEPTRGGVTWIETHPHYRRAGLATRMWNMANELAQTNPDIVAPEHSNTRTKSGDAWAKKVGGRVPEHWGDFVEDDGIL